MKQKNWKGNVRELENTIARACILSNYSMIKMIHLPDLDSIKDVSLGSVKEMEMKLIIDALKSVRKQNKSSGPARDNGKNIA